MTRIDVNQVRRADVVLGDDETEVQVEGVYEPSGEFANLELVMVHEDRILGRVTVCELEYVVKLVDAIIAVLPPVTAANIRGGV